MAWRSGPAGAGDDSGLGVQGLGTNGTVKVVVVGDDAEAWRAFDASGLKDVVAFGVARDGENSILEEFAVQALAGFRDRFRGRKSQKLRNPPSRSQREKGG